MTRHTRAPYRIHSGFWTTAVCLALLAPVGLAQADDQPSGKHVGNNKHVGKPSPRVLAADLNRPRPLTLATPNKLTAPAPHVRDAIVQLSARSTWRSRELRRAVRIFSLLRAPWREVALASRRTGRWGRRLGAPKDGPLAEFPPR